VEKFHICNIEKADVAATLHICILNVVIWNSIRQYFWTAELWEKDQGNFGRNNRTSDKIWTRIL
jgi:hypothetical protein